MQNNYPELPARKGDMMEKLINLMGIAGVVGGLCLILIQGINFLMKGTWIPHTVYGAVENTGLGDTLAAHPDLMGYMEKCPLSLAIIVAGIIFLWIASKLRNV